ncbi:small ribosomal subunit protein uS10m-like [Littorina saxatilis]|uniref:Small ribosomal subunit protein uS10m n=1 Tax=Littorina saxatilis TaxID=31220 RepID=A0AAN9BDW2_9CAEN
MATSLFRLGHLAVTRLVCTQCGDAVASQLTRSVAFPNTCLSSWLLVAKPFSSYAQAGEETEEPDDLFRQVTVEVKGHDKAVVKSYTEFVTMAANELGINLARVFQPPKIISRYTLLKSVHIYSKHMVQYESRTHFTVFEMKHLTGSTADTFLEYIQRNLPEGMAMKVSKDRIEKVPEHLVPPKKQTSKTAKSPPAS